MHVRSLSLLIVLVFLPVAAFAQKKSVYDLPSSQVAIQPRKYEMNHSALVSAGYIPTDSFNRGFTFTGAYRYALVSYFTLEGSYIWVANQKTSLEGELRNTGVTVENVGLGGVLDYPRQIYMVGVHYAPMYSKNLLFNSKLVYSETSLFLGLGSINFNQVGYKAMAAPGLATRIYLGPKSAVIGYFRDFFYMDDKRGVVGIIDFGLGFEYGFGRGKAGNAGETRDQF